MVENKLDSYIKQDAETRPLYIKTKAFVNALEDNLSNDALMPFLNNELKNGNTNNILEKSKQIINKCKQSTILNIMFVNNDTFRVRYFDVETDEPEFQIDVIFKDKSDHLIDKLKMKDKEVLMQELQKRIEFNQKVERGEISPPPPPARN